MQGHFKFCIEKHPYGYVELDDNKKVLIEDVTDANFAIDNDLVEINFDTNRYIISKILKRQETRISGVLCLSSHVVLGFTKSHVPLKKFIPIDKKYPPIAISTKRRLQSSNVYATIKISGLNENTKYIVGTLESIIGNVGDYKAEIEFLKYKHNIRWKKYPPIKVPSENYNDLYDFRDNAVFSIDPSGCNDIDDAIHIVDQDLYYQVGIHIADVSAFIEEGSPIDIEASKRCESVYLVNEQINMIPNELAYNYCSLLEGQVRRSFSVLFTIDKNSLDIVDTQFKKGLIINKKAMSYDEAESLIDTVNSDITISLNKLYKLGKLLYEKNITDTYDTNDKYDTHKLVEIFMVMTNSAVAQYLINNSPNPVILRKHTGSKCELINSEQYTGDIKSVVKLANIIKMNRAEYVVVDPNDKNRTDLIHKGLNAAYYTHFTSPIRRYVDIMIHRMLYDLLINSPYNTTTPNYIDYVNNSHKNIQSASNDSVILDTIYKIYNNNESILDTYAYVVSVEDTLLMLYVPKLDLTTRCKVFSDKIKHLVNYTSTDESININERYIINIFDKLEIKIVIATKDHRLNRKMLIQLRDIEIL